MRIIFSNECLQHFQTVELKKIDNKKNKNESISTYVSMLWLFSLAGCDKKSFIVLHGNRLNRSLKDIREVK